MGMKLEHGKSYINRDGEVVTITVRAALVADGYQFPCLGSDGHCYTMEGEFLGDDAECPHDLIGPALSAF